MDQTVPLQSSCEKVCRHSTLPSTDWEENKIFQVLRGNLHYDLCRKTVHTGARITWHPT